MSEVPQVLGPYHLKGKLAVGGQSEVWLGIRRGPGGFRRRCAVKIVAPPLSLDDAARKNFFAEARLQAQFDHPNLVAVTDLGVDDDNDILYSVMPYVSGRSLASLLLEKPDAFNTLDGLFVMSRIMRALHYAHTLRDERGRTMNVIHRDVSPENVLIGFDGQVKLLDFGIALSSINPRSTRMHVVKGKLEYLSPEQASATTDITTATDVYSAGLMLYRLLTGVSPLSGDPDTALARARNPNVRRLRDLGNFSPKLEMLVHDMLALDPSSRPQNAAEISRSLLVELRDIQPDYTQFDFTAAAQAALEGHFEAEKSFLNSVTEDAGTQVIDTRAFNDAREQKSESRKSKGRRRKTLQPSRGLQRTPTLDVKEDVKQEIASQSGEEGLDDIFRELEEIYDD